MKTNVKDYLAAAREDPRRLALLAWLFLLLALPFFAFPGRVGGATNAAACIALDACAVEVASRLWRPADAVYVSRATQRTLMAAGIFTLAPYIFFEVGSIPWLLNPTTETLAGYWPLPLGSAFLFTGSALGYWPLTLSGGLCTLCLRVCNSDEPDNLESAPDRPVYPAALAGIILAGLLRQPLMPVFRDAPAHSLPAIACGLALAAAVVARAIEDDNVSPTILAHSLGVLAWNVLTRVADPLGHLPFDPLWALAPLAVVAGVLVTRSAPHIDAGHTDESPVVKKNEPVSPAAQPRRAVEALEGYDDLTPAERSSIKLLASGSSAAGIAEELGKSPSTVRVLLGRAYKKLGVVGQAGLEAALASEPGPSEQSSKQPTDGPADPVSSTHRSIRGLTLLSTALLAVAVPFPTAATLWGAGRTTYLPLALGLLSAGCLGLLPIVLGPQSAGDTKKRDHARKVAVAATTVCGVLSLICKALETLDIVSGAIDPLSIAASFLFGFVLTWAQRLAEPIGAPSPATLRALRPADLPPLAIALAAGIGIEELWRSIGYFSVLPQLMPLFALISVGCLVLLWQEDRRLIAAAALAHAAALAALGPSRAIALCCIAFCTLTAIKLPQATRVLDASLPHLTPALGAGILAGDVIVGSFADRLSFNDVALAYLGGQNGLLALGGFALGVAFCVVGVAAVVYCLRLRDDAEAEGLDLASSAPATAERARAYLTSRGLGEAETSTALLIAQGLTGREASERLNYSLGAVNTLRRTAYAKLGVHSRRELLSSISSATRDVN